MIRSLQLATVPRRVKCSHSQKKSRIKHQGWRRQEMVVNLTVVPIGKDSSLSAKVAEVLKIISDSGISYKLHSMGTILEGEWDEIMRLIKKCHKKILKDSDRVLTTITIDDRKGRTDLIAGKVKSVEEKLGKKLKT